MWKGADEPWRDAEFLDRAQKIIDAPEVEAEAWLVPGPVTVGLAVFCVGVAGAGRESEREGLRESLVAQDIEIVMDGGAYCTLTPVVLSRGALHAGGPYRCPDVRIRARANAFIQQMVRSLVGTLLQVGEGRRSPGDMPAVLQRPNPLLVEAARPGQQRREAARTDLDGLVIQ